MTTKKRVLSVQECRARAAALPEEWYSASASAASTMAGMPLTTEDFDALRRMRSGETTFAEERDRILSETRQRTAQTRQAKAE
ncbi:MULTISPECIES: hypothetical protein [Gordonia]|jgi:hypothetical protein|uniref:Uncharacterized protein n=1 Tax=Gordonia sihwensis NBRC 108236 TaxID=1223544 RepID=L7LQ69_9ACTN|nr:MULTISPECIES: hypothetical protein [Gordonia]AUH70538.1 hypothetical protein CXX93_19140 [Gordonia sp. YC-JH1]KJR00980.1 hypothetical protein UG54_19510 [Gordonia sihwensis]WFN95105.1 hypothetical protein P5P27_20235 [Gordonia sihwensis]GAC62322.1 hypothetical protein GSI01S_33_00080 [Gordonia sihwensis NBRC 108236]